MNKEKKAKEKVYSIHLKAYLPSALWALVIFILSDQRVLPGFNISLLDFVFKKLAHMFVYAVLYFLLFRAYQITHPAQELSRKYYLWPLLIALFYAISDELHQSVVKGRQANARDVAYDFLGMMSVLLHQQKML